MSIKFGKYQNNNNNKTNDLVDWKNSSNYIEMSKKRNSFYKRKKKSTKIFWSSVFSIDYSSKSSNIHMKSTKK